MIRYTVAVSGVAAVAIGTSLWLGHSLLNERKACAERIEAARLAGVVEALQGRADALDLQARALAEDAQRLLADLDAARTRQIAAADRWQKWARDLPPLPEGCGPGADRVEAFNRVMRGE